ncbi:MAG TPA: tRNA adenosine(34) deaminase TadA [Thermodesulfobacteriota bacterium]|nr:tRNA adenosine(34) deaminase TadA [Thermodesulfobacteriota bacterium]
MEAKRTDKLFMSEALKEARKAKKRGEVPVGAVVVHEGEVIARGYNRKESASDPTAHAEVVAITRAAKKLKRWRLAGTTLYVTLEPCLMCMGAIVQARIPRLVFASLDPKAGACGSLYDISNDRRLNHRVHVTRGVAEEESREILKEFFLKLRKKT